MKLMSLVELWRYRELLWLWTMRGVKVRYKQSLFGGAWAILQPLSLMLMFSFIFIYVIQVPTDNVPYPIFSYTAVLPWTLFAGAITLAVPSLVDNLNMVTKIYFPREILPLSAIGVALVDFLVASMVFVGLVIVCQVPVSITWLWVPLLLSIQLLLMAGIVLIASAVIVFYRDVRFIVGLGMQLWMYATPIIYPITLIPKRFRSLYMLNPMVGLIDSYRRVILYGEPPSPYLLISALTGVIAFFVGYWFFKSVDWKFADVI